jgi:putative transposase
MFPRSGGICPPFLDPAVFDLWEYPCPRFSRRRGKNYRTLADYIQLNPVRARLVLPGKGQSVLDYPWSSVAGGWAVPPGRRPKWLAAEEGLQRFDLPDTVAGRRRLVERLDRRAVEEEIKKCGMPVLPEDVDARCSHLRRGWYWGSQEFAGKLHKLSEKLMKERQRSSRAYRKTPQVAAHSQEQAEHWLAAGLKAAGLVAKDLPGLKGSDPRKLALAELIWKRTTVSQEWIAGKLSMRSAANVSQQLRRFDRVRTQSKLSPEMQVFLKEAWNSTM